MTKKQKQKIYDMFFEEQEGSCALCVRTDVELFLDHDHECCRRNPCGRCYRGLLCPGCNKHMGEFDAALRGALLVGERTTMLITAYYPRETDYVIRYARRRDRIATPYTARSRTERGFPGRP